ncbi:hypothetical protein C8046_16280 [Serinibacter arcticus]|uniref:Uncharacterized protein n=1 Tax=Serinibacter arcticus TaxID=1655435 RepID=A0A2U1ZY99_9MICO|nr:hypothetical protein [Serinibacter arcticus]PWD51968.1 hypothetical protein C8046_16280 [Serinibacter arcticus]
MPTPTSPSWNLHFEIDDGVATDPARPRTRVGPVPQEPHHGWSGGFGPALAWKHWPRNGVTGLPMMHALTLWLPAEFQRAGSEHPGLAYFASSGESMPTEQVQADPGSDDPFLADLARAEDHPMLRRRTDVLDAEHALVWLTADELARGPRAPAPDVRRPGEHRHDSQLNAWDDAGRHRRIWLAPRADPNGGLAPRESWERSSEDGYVSPRDEHSQLVEWARSLHLVSHLGGTSFPVNELPTGLTPWYLELEEIGLLNFGSGNAQIDLESGAFGWS